jgi:hypothetical protein
VRDARKTDLQTEGREFNPLNRHHDLSLADRVFLRLPGDSRIGQYDPIVPAHRRQLSPKIKNLRQGIAGGFGGLS